MLIVDMPMPRSCVMCEVADQGFCEIKNESVMDLRGAYFDKRPDWCPIKGELVRCGECESWDTENSSGRKSLKNYRCACLEWSNLEDGYYVYTAEDEYCSRAERKDGIR